MYFVGCFINEYKIKLNKYILFPILILTAFLNTFILYFYAQGGTLESLNISECYLFSVIISVLVFLLLYDIKCNKKFVVKTIRFLSDVSFGTYLISYCFDDYIYKSTLFLKSNPYYFVICVLVLTPIIFILSSIASYIVSLFIKIFFFRKEKR